MNQCENCMKKDVCSKKEAMKDAVKFLEDKSKAKKYQHLNFEVNCNSFVKEEKFNIKGEVK